MKRDRFLQKKGIGLCITYMASTALWAQSLLLIPQNEILVVGAPVSFAVGDLNGDGILDLVVAEQQSAAVAILLGVGRGFFRSAGTHGVGLGPIAIAIGEFNRDGKPDLVIANPGSNTVSLLLGNGDGTFRPAATLAAVGPMAISIGDFNRDGNLDLAIANATANDVSIFLGNGNGTFRVPISAAVGARPIAIAVGDLDNDGKLDLAVANVNSGDISVLIGNGDGTFRPSRNFNAGQVPASITVGDFNNDNRLDLAVANSTGLPSTVSVLLGNGDGTFRPRLSFPAGLNPSCVVVADFNNDGKPDLAVANSTSSTVSVLLGTGDGLFQSPWTLLAGYGPIWIAAPDLNADGYPDLITSSAVSNSVSVLINRTRVPDQPMFSGDSLVNSASYMTGPVSPGEVVTIFGSSLGPDQSVGFQLASGFVTTELAETRVLFDGIPAPLMGVSGNQINAIVPYEVAGRTSTEVVAETNGRRSRTITFPLADSAPGLFTVDGSGTGQGTVLNEDGAVNSVANPAAKGSIIVLFGTGQGQTDPRGIDGQLTGNILSKPLLSVIVTVGGQDAQVLDASSAAGFVAGVIQVKVRLPDGIGSGAVLVTLKVGSTISQPGVTVSVR